MIKVEPEHTTIISRIPETRAEAVSEIVKLTIKLGLTTPSDASRVLEEIDNSIADNITYLFTGVADREIVRRIGMKLRSKINR